jgi:hypothetical protein
MPPGITRNPGATVLATIALAAGIAFALKGDSLEKRTEFVTCTGTGGLAKYAYCNWQEPSGNEGSGSYITALYYSVGKSPVAVGVDCTIGKSATESGTTAIPYLTDITTGTGQTFLPIGFGYKGTFGFGTGAMMVTEGDYVRCVTLSDPTSTHTASLYIEYLSRRSY